MLPHGIAPPDEQPSFELQMIDYLRARLRQEAFGTKDDIEFMPQWVPSAIRISGDIMPGDWPCGATLYGLILICEKASGRTIKIDLFQCEVLAFRWNESRATVIREKATGTDFETQLAEVKAVQKSRTV